MPRPLFFFLCGGGEKRSGGSPIHFLCSRIYNFWGSLISGDEQQRPVNEATIGNTALVTKDVALPSRRAPYSYCCFVNRPLLFITTNQRSPKVVDPAAQKNVLEIDQTLFFSAPTQKEKKAVWARDYPNGKEGLYVGH